MSFIAGFYSLSVSLQNADKNQFVDFRIKVPRHPDETLQHLNARFLVYVHNFMDGLEFAQDLFDLKEPSLWRRDITGEILDWIYIGVPQRKTLESALRSKSTSNFSIYFTNPETPIQFIHEMKGSRFVPFLNVKFWMISEDILNGLSEKEQSSSVWSVTCVDDHLYLVCNGVELDTQIERLDMVRLTNDFHLRNAEQKNE